MNFDFVTKDWITGLWWRLSSAVIQNCQARKTRLSNSEVLNPFPIQTSHWTAVVTYDWVRSLWPLLCLTLVFYIRITDLYLLPTCSGITLISLHCFNLLLQHGKYLWTWYLIISSICFTLVSVICIRIAYLKSITTWSAVSLVFMVLSFIQHEKENISSIKPKEVKGQIWSKYTYAHGNFEFGNGLQSDMDLKS